MKEGKFVVEVREVGNVLVVDVTIDGGVMHPEELNQLAMVVENTVGTKYYGKGVIISGRLPVWAHSAIAHLFHPAKFVAHFDPRLGGGVVVASHDTNYRVGQVIPVEL